MPGTPADQRSSSNHPNNLSFLYQRHRSRPQGLENPNLRPLPSVTGNHGLGRQDSYAGEKLYKIYPKEIMRAKPNYRTGTSNPIASPLLSALGSTTAAAQYTSDWARSLSFSSNHQPQLGSSPPPISLIPAGRESGQSIATSSSPPSSRPQSHPNQYQSFGGRQRQGSNNSPRRASLYSQYGSPYAHIPMPHEDQPHFHGLPDMDSLIPQAMGQNLGLAPGDKGYFCGFDTLSNAGHGPSASAELVLLCGFEGGLVTYKIGTKMIQRIGLLENVRGGVIGAKILPWTFRADPGDSQRPYVALVVHGPVIADDNDSSGGSDDQSSDSNPSSNSNNRGRDLFLPDLVKCYRTTVEIYSLSSRRHVATVFESPLIPVEYSQVGELKMPKPFGDLRLDAKGKFLTITSGDSGEIFIYSPFTHDPDVHNLESIRCIGKLWTSIHRREIKLPANPPSPNGSPGSGGEETEIVRLTPIIALSERWIAVVPPSGSSTQFSIKGNPLVHSPNGREAWPPGIKSQAPPPTRPETTCGIDVPEGSMSDSIIDKFSRGVTQGVVRGAQWVSEKGKQAWTSYWNPQDGSIQGYPPQQMHHDAAFPPTHGHNALQPTNSPAPPTQVSVFDLERFLECETANYSKRATKAALTPLATFEIPSGCSFLSFAPHGYHLLTASRKGDEYVVWNLLRMVNPPSSNTSDNVVLTSEPYVRQALRLTRMTTATVSDIIWDALPPFHKKFGIVTGAGTLHAHLIPDVAFTWPPPRNSGRRARRRAASNDARYEQREDEQGQRPATAVIGTAVGMASSTASWLRGVGAGASSAVSAVSTTGRPKSLSAAAVGTSTRAVKYGLTAGANMVANGASSMYRAGENKLHVPGLAGVDMGNGATVVYFRGSKKDHTRLLSGKSGNSKKTEPRRASMSVGSGSSAGTGTALYGYDEEEDDDDGPDAGSKRGCFVAVVANGMVSVYPVRETSIPRKGLPSVPLAAVGRRAVEFGLYKIPDDVFAPSFRRKVERRFGTTGKDGKDGTDEEEEDFVGGEWLPRAPAGAGYLQPPNAQSSRNSSQVSGIGGKNTIQQQIPQDQTLKPPKTNKKGRASSSSTTSSPAPSTSHPIPSISPPAPPSVSRKITPARMRMDHSSGNNWHATVEAETNPPYRPFHTDGCVVQFNDAEEQPTRASMEASRETARVASPPPKLDISPGPSPNLSPSPATTPSPSVSPAPGGKKKKKGKKAPKEEVEEEKADYDSHAIVPPQAPLITFDDDLTGSAIRDMANISIKVDQTPITTATTIATTFDETQDDDKWVFGTPLPRGTPLFSSQSAGARSMIQGGLEGSNVIPFGEDPYGDDVESDIRVVEGPEGEQVVVTTVRSSRRGPGEGPGEDEEDFFEEGCEIVDWADERV